MFDYNQHTISFMIIKNYQIQLKQIKEMIQRMSGK